MKKPSLAQAISCIAFMALAVAIGYGLLKINIQLLLILSAAYVALLSMHLGYNWRDMEKSISLRIGNVMPAIMIMISVGIVVGTWTYSGTVPMLIYYGLKIIEPKLFLPLAFIIVAIASTATGTSWGSASTVGVALMGIAIELGIPLHIASGAIIAGAVFGDKISPLSDTTNLAALVCEVDLFDHVKNMTWTTIPASIIGLIIYFIVGQNIISPTSYGQGTVTLLDSLDSIFNWNIFLLIPILIIFIGSFLKKPTVPVMLISSATAIIVGTASHGFKIVDGLNSTFSGFNIKMIPITENFNPNLLTQTVSNILNRGGMTSMMTIVLTIICGYAFASVMEMGGFLDVLLESMIDKIQSLWQLIGVTILGSVILVFSTGVATIPILMIGTLLKEIYSKMGISHTVLSRTLEDSGTMLLPFVPWGVSGILYKEVLGVSTLDYSPWVIPCYLCVFIAMFYAITGIGIAKDKILNGNGQ